MGSASLACALVAVATLPITHTGKYVALGLALFAVGLGLSGYPALTPAGIRRRPAQRLTAAAGAAIGVGVGLLALLKIALTLIAVEGLRGLLDS